MTDAPHTPDSPDTPGTPDSSHQVPGKPLPEREAAPQSTSGAFADGMAAAARRAGFAAATAGEPISGHALLAAMGGIRGLVEAVLPGLVFLVTYTLTRALIPALVAPTVIGLAFVGLRILKKEPVTQAVGGLVGTAIGVALALLSGNAADYFLAGFWTNAAYGGALLVSALVGWPLLGLAVGFLMGEGTAWRDDPSKRRVLTILTLMWAGLFAARLAVQLPLYFAGNVEWLGAMKLLMGLPLYAPLLVVSWLMVRSIYPKPVEGDTGPDADDTTD